MTLSRSPSDDRTVAILLRWLGAMVVGAAVGTGAACHPCSTSDCMPTVELAKRCPEITGCTIEGQASCGNSGCPPEYVGILSRGDFYRVAVGYHIIQRVTSGIEEHGGFPGYYVALSLLTFYPWSALMPPALVGAWSRRTGNPALGFLLAGAAGLVLLAARRVTLRSHISFGPFLIGGTLLAMLAAGPGPGT